MSKTSGLRCPECGHGNHDVIDSRPSPHFIRRRRQCRLCGARWSTAEMNKDDLAILVEQALRARELREAMDRVM